MGLILNDLSPTVVVLLLVLFAPTLWLAAQTGIRVLSRLLSKLRAKQG